MVFFPIFGDQFTIYVCHHYVGPFNLYRAVCQLYINKSGKKSNYTYLPTARPLAYTPDTNGPLNTAHIPTQAPLCTYTAHTHTHTIHTETTHTIHITHTTYSHPQHTQHRPTIYTHFCVYNNNFLSYLLNRPWKRVHFQFQYRPYL